MKSNKLRAVQLFVLAISAVVTIWAMLRAADWQMDFAGLALICLAISPYVVLYAVGVLLEKYTSLPRVALVSCVVAVLMLAFTLLAYIGTLGDTSSTYALIFIFVPINLYIGGFALLVIGLLAAWLIARLATKTSD